jgi:peroxiredoxin Q/BCP
MAQTPEIGAQAPGFELRDGDGNLVRLEDQRGSTTILYFYPKDDTAGCTKEACGFRDQNHEIQEQGATILGVSADDESSHQAFAGKYNLNFPLLADVDKTAVQDYGVWRERTRGDQTFWGIARVTFAIDDEGKIANVWEVSDAESHSQEVLDWLKAR